MQTIPIDQAQSGMVVQEDVINENGLVLLNPGTKLTDALISRLKKWGVSQVSIPKNQTIEVKIESDETPGSEDKSEKIEALDKRFGELIHDPILNKVYVVLKDRIENPKPEIPENEDIE